MGNFIFGEGGDEVHCKRRGVFNFCGLCEISGAIGYFFAILVLLIRTGYSMAIFVDYGIGFQIGKVEQIIFFFKTGHKFPSYVQVNNKP
jgi:hypothetical protein